MGWRGLAAVAPPFKMGQFRPKINEIRVSTFWRSGNPMFSHRRPMPACSPVSFEHPQPFFCKILFEKIYRNSGFSLQGPYPSYDIGCLPIRNM